jgi:hypothetical protein
MRIFENGLFLVGVSADFRYDIHTKLHFSSFENDGHAPPQAHEAHCAKGQQSLDGRKPKKSTAEFAGIGSIDNFRIFGKQLN